MNSPTIPKQTSPIRNGIHRLRKIFAGDCETCREVADHWLFLIGIGVESILLILLALKLQEYESERILRGVGFGLLVLLFVALASHQFFIFRNSSLHNVPDRRRRRHEIMICFLFGVLTGEIGYIYVLARCNHLASWVSWSDVLFGPAGLPQGAEWNMEELGVALKAIFAFGAALLFLLVLVWDLRITLDEASRKRYLPQLYFFWIMDLLATVIWIAVMGVVLPDYRLGLSNRAWITLLTLIALTYGLVAIVRVCFAVVKLGAYDTDRTALEQQVI